MAMFARLITPPQNNWRSIVPPFGSDPADDPVRPRGFVIIRGGRPGIKCFGHNGFFQGAQAPRRPKLDLNQFAPQQRASCSTNSMTSWPGCVSIPCRDELSDGEETS